MPSQRNKMDHNLDDQFLAMQARIDDNRQVSEEKMKEYDSKFDK